MLNMEFVDAFNKIFFHNSAFNDEINSIFFLQSMNE